jgi:hypothetical protein
MLCAFTPRRVAAVTGEAVLFFAFGAFLRFGEPAAVALAFALAARVQRLPLPFPAVVPPTSGPSTRALFTWRGSTFFAAALVAFFADFLLEGFAFVAFFADAVLGPDACLFRAFVAFSAGAVVAAFARLLLVFVAVLGDAVFAAFALFAGLLFAGGHRDSSSSVLVNPPAEPGRSAASA